MGLLTQSPARPGRYLEFKRADAPQITPSMRTALRDLELEALYVVFPGDRRYLLGERVQAAVPPAH